MSNLFTTILNMSLTASIIIGIVLLARLCLKKAPKIFSYVLWSVVLFRLLCPVSISLPVSVLAPMSDASTSAGTNYTASMEYISLPDRPANENTHQSVPGENTTTEDTVNTNNPILPADLESDTSAVVVEQQKRSAGKIVLSVLAWLWAAGMVGVLGMTTWQTISLKRRLADACIIRGNIFESDKIDTAFILGVFNPKIYLPLGLPFDIQKAVVAHEQTHQRRGDHIVKLVSYIALAIHWFNPLVWLSFKLMCDDMEKSCDEAVIRTMYDRGYTIKSTKKAYGEMLLALGGGRKHIFSPVSFAENSTKERVLNIVDYSRIARNAGIALCSVCVLIAALCVVNPVSAATSVVDNIGANASDSDETADEHAPDAVLLTIGDVTFWSDVTELDLSINQNITDISNIKYCTDLRSLNISYNGNLEDISPLKHCTMLTSLKASNCYISDISVIASLDNLEYLDISNNSIDNLAPLAKCEKLVTLNITDCAMHDGSPLGGSDLRRLASLPNLTHLYVGTLEIESIPIFSEFSALKHLSIGGSFNYRFENISAAVNATVNGLAELHKAVPQLEGLTFAVFDYDTAPQIAKFENLRSLDIQVDINDDNPDYSALSALSALTKLEALNLNMTANFSLDFISEFDSLESLSLCYDNYGINLSESPDGIINLQPIACCQNLKTFTLDMPIEGAICYGLDSICHLPKLELLSAYSPGTTLDLSTLSVSSSFAELELQKVDILHMDSIRNLKNLKYLGLVDCTSNYSDYSPSDFEALSALESLEFINISNADGKSVIDLSFATSMANLKTVYISAYSVQGISGLRNSTDMKTLWLSNVDEDEDFSELNVLTALNDILLESENGLDDLSFMNSMVNLTEIGLQGNYTNVDALNGMVLAQRITLDSPELVDISGLSGCKNIRYLNFYGCSKLNDTSPLKMPNKLSYVAITDTPISDLSFIAYSDQKVVLDLINPHITDFTSLYDVIDQLAYLFYEGDELSFEQAEELHRLNEDCGIIYNGENIA